MKILPLGRRRAAPIVLALVGAQITAGCSTVDAAITEHLNAYTANDAQLDRSAVESFVVSQNEIMDQLERLAGPIVTDGKPNWRPTVDAGIHYVDIRCANYIQAIFWFDRARNAASRQTQLLGASAAATLSLIEASKELIGLTPLGFSLLDQTIDNIGDSLLFALPPSAVNQLVEERQRAYVDGLSAEYRDRVTALRAIQGYVEICLSSNLEAAAVEAVATEKFKPKSPGDAGGEGVVPADEDEAGEGESATNPPPDTIPVLEPA